VSQTRWWDVGDATYPCFDPADLSRSFWSRKSGMKLQPSEFREVERLLLGHITSSESLRDIRRHGLLPHGKAGREIIESDGLRSDPNGVYLLTRPDSLYFDRIERNERGEPMLVLVEVEVAKLAGDEACVGAEEAQRDPFRALFYSLCFGQCKHLGPIPAHAIRGFYARDGTPISPGQEEA
jgi:hypothetical protein